MSERSSDARSQRILFVCLGNICRSPMAEGVFRHLLRDSGLEERYEVDSAGTGAWHVGSPPDSRAREVARRNGVRLEGSARQVRKEDFQDFDLVLAMDRENLRNLEGLEAPGGRGAALRLLREFDPEAEHDLEVPDPYYGGPEGFDRVFELVRRSCASLLEALEEGEAGGGARSREDDRGA